MPRRGPCRGGRRRAGGRRACTRGRPGRPGRASTGTSRQPRTRRPSLGGDVLDAGLGGGALVGVVGQEGHADGVGARRRQVGSPATARRKRVGDLGEDAGTVTDQRVGAGGAAVVEVAQGVEGVVDDVVAGGAPHRRHHGHTAGVVLVLAAVQAGVGGLGGEAGDGHVASPSSGSSAAERPGTARSGADGSGHVPEGYRRAPASCHLSRAIPHPGTSAHAGGAVRRLRLDILASRRRRRPGVPEDPDAQRNTTMLVQTLSRWPRISSASSVRSFSMTIRPTG